MDERVGGRHAWRVTVYGYILRCAEDTYSIGSSEDLAKRLAEHRHGSRIPAQKVEPRRERGTHMAEVTRWLNASTASRDEEMFAGFYAELYKIARSRMSGERPDQTLDTTWLVHAAWPILIFRTQLR